jgi:primosomal protein N' (replication factor Y)
MQSTHPYCDVALPVPLDQLFTYELPESLRHRAQVGARVLVPFGARKLTGFILRLHDTPPGIEVREALRLIDEQLALDAEMISLARWIAGYYCSPLGEVLRSMAPLTGEIRRTRVYSLTPAGMDVARRLHLAANPDDPAVKLLTLLESRPLAASSLSKKIPHFENVTRSLFKKNLIQIEEVHAARDPLRASTSRLRVEFSSRPADAKFGKSERELLAYLELHPGSHNLGQVEKVLPSASPAARRLARRGVLRLTIELPSTLLTSERLPHRLNAHQQAAFDAIHAALVQQQFHAFLLQGVTGSGKTEIYLNAIETALGLGRGALLLVPEIALTPAVAGQFFHRFGNRVAILHSAFSDIERSEQWRRIQAGDALVVVGTRSGVFAPVRNIGLIIVDEEHDASYKQEENPRYHGRDVAVVRARSNNAVVVLGSATPSLESRYNVDRGKYTRLLLPERIESRPMPSVRIVDLRQEFLETRRVAVFSRKLVEEIQARLASGEQTMLLLNRRGFSSFVACRACGYRVQCPNCAVTLTFHKRDRRLLCHYCNHAERVPSVCPSCSSEYIQFLGTGAEKVEEELLRDFAGARVARMDRDTVASKRDFETILHGFREGAYDILVGTQMIAKGHDIPNVTFVGVVNGDIGLGLPDFRAAERIFQLLTQAAGRAGRGDIPGAVLVQTINPDHYAIAFAAAQDYEGFYARELQYRRLMRYPPFVALANLLVRHQTQEGALRMSTELGALLSPPPEGMRVLGPAEAPVPRMKSEYRYQLLIKSTNRKLLNQVLQRLRNYAVEKGWNATALVIDVDPLSLL